MCNFGGFFVSDQVSCPDVAILKNLALVSQTAAGRAKISLISTPQAREHMCNFANDLYASFSL